MSGFHLTNRPVNNTSRTSRRADKGEADVSPSAHLASVGWSCLPSLPASFWAAPCSLPPSLPPSPVDDGAPTSRRTCRPGNCSAFSPGTQEHAFRTTNPPNRQGGGG